MLAALALTITTSAALTLPLARNTSLVLLTPTNITSSALEQPAELDDPTWPKRPYYITLEGTGYIGVRMTIHSVELPITRPVIDVRNLQLFLRDFADNLRQEYPIPSFIPREVTQYTIDVTTYTRWTLRMKEAPWQGRLPTAVALAALDTLDKELGKYGMAIVEYTIELTWRRGVWCYGDVYLEKLVGTSWNDSLSNENDNLQTA